MPLSKTCIAMLAVGLFVGYMFGKQKRTVTVA
jgi:hypothetical protein